MDSWQTLAVQVRNDKLAVYHAPRGKAPRLLGGDIAVSTTMNTNALRLGVSGQSGFRFDNVSVHARSLDAAKSTTYAYNTSNQLTSSVTNSVTTTYTYDAWGRLLTRTAGTASASYTYRGDKLRKVTSTFAGEASTVDMNYDGFGRRRNRMANGVPPITWWRYGLGWDTVAEYTDNDTDWAVEGFSKFNVMTDFMHPLAEATVASGQAPANAAYSYLALDHLSSTRGVFSQTKTQTGTMEFLPYGARHTATGTLPHHQFTAKPYDTGTGLYYFPYRMYSSSMARWTTTDPIGTMDGPNVYGYVKSRVLNSNDPLGDSATIVIGGVVVGISLLEALAVLLVATAAASLLYMKDHVDWNCHPTVPGHGHQPAPDHRPPTGTERGCSWGCMIFYMNKPLYITCVALCVLIFGGVSGNA